MASVSVVRVPTTPLPSEIITLSPQKALAVHAAHQRLMNFDHKVPDRRLPRCVGDTRTRLDPLPSTRVDIYSKATLVVLYPKLCEVRQWRHFADLVDNAKDIYQLGIEKIAIASALNPDMMFTIFKQTKADVKGFIPIADYLAEWAEDMGILMKDSISAISGWGRVPRFTVMIFQDGLLKARHIPEIFELDFTAGKIIEFISARVAKDGPLLKGFNFDMDELSLSSPAVPVDRVNSSVIDELQTYTRAQPKLICVGDQLPNVALNIGGKIKSSLELLKPAEGEKSIAFFAIGQGTPTCSMQLQDIFKEIANIKKHFENVFLVMLGSCDEAEAMLHWNDPETATLSFELRNIKYMNFSVIPDLHGDLFRAVGALAPINSDRGIAPSANRLVIAVNSDGKVDFVLNEEAKECSKTSAKGVLEYLAKGAPVSAREASDTSDREHKKEKV